MAKISPLPGSPPRLAIGAVFGLAYYCAAEAGHFLSFPASEIATFWPASGLILAVLLLAGPRYWWPILAGSLVANVASDRLTHGHPAALGLASWAATAIGALTTAWLLPRFGFRVGPLRRIRDVWLLFVAAAVIGSTLGATLGAAAVAKHTGTGLGAAWAVWWVSDLLGILLVTPLVLSWTGSHRPWFARSQLLRQCETVLALSALVVVGRVVFSDVVADHSPMLQFPYLLFPFLLWAGLRLGPRWSAVAVFLLGIGVAYHTTRGQGPFNAFSHLVADQALLLQTFLGVAAFTAIALAAEMAERADVTEALRGSEDRLTEANARLAALATTDPLTELPNRRAFDEALAREAALAARTGLPLSIVVLDVDHFKAYNDSFGHPAGDEVLRRLGVVLRAELRETDLPVRLGGEEFAALLPDTDAPGAVVLAKRVRRAVEAEPWPLRRVTISAGVAALRAKEGLDAALRMVEEADRAMYLAKREGRNRVAASQPPDPAMEARVG